MIILVLVSMLSVTYLMYVYAWYMCIAIWTTGLDWIPAVYLVFSFLQSFPSWFFYAVIPVLRGHCFERPPVKRPHVSVRKTYT